MPSNNRITANVTDSFLSWLATYAAERNLTLSEALASLAQPGAQAAGFTGQIINRRGKYCRKSDKNG